MEETDIFSQMSAVINLGRTAGGSSDERIAQAESTLGVRFPRSYRIFLGSFGAGAIGHIEVAGLSASEISGKPPRWSDVVRDTLRARRVSHGTIPESLVLIAGDGTDYTFFIDTAKRSDEDECPIVVLGPGADGVVAARDFMEFLNKAAARVNLIHGSRE
jgi:hypothetical protein